MRINEKFPMIYKHMMGFQHSLNSDINLSQKYLNDLFFLFATSIEKNFRISIIKSYLESNLGVKYLSNCSLITLSVVLTRIIHEIISATKAQSHKE